MSTLRTKNIFKPSKQMWSAVGKALTKHSVERGIPPQTAPHEEYGTVKTYHVDVIGTFYNKLLADQHMLGKYRKEAA